MEAVFSDKITSILDEIDSTATSRIPVSAQALHAHLIQGRFILYGAGQNGAGVVEKLRKIDLVPLAIADNTPSKTGTQLNEIPILSPEQARLEYGDGVCTVVTIFNPSVDYKTIKERLKNDGFVHVFSFLDLFYLFPDLFLPFYQFAAPAAIAAQKQELLKAFELFKEEKSKDVFFSNLAFRLKLDYPSLQPPDYDYYFPEDLFGSNLASPGCIYIDCGAFDGDTVKKFTKTNPGFGAVYAFEPDEANFSKLTGYVLTLPKENTGKTFLFQLGVSQRHGFERFCSNNSMGSSLREDGTSIVQTVALDELLYEKLKFSNREVFLKFDIEGEEENAITGCKNIIADVAPHLAISIYHKEDDLWRIPLYIQSINPHYSFFLRQHGPDGMDLVLYAKPNR